MVCPISLFALYLRGYLTMERMMLTRLPIVVRSDECSDDFDPFVGYDWDMDRQVWVS